MITQPNNVHLNQPGILPPPLQTQPVHATTVRPLVMAQDPTHMVTPFNFVVIAIMQNYKL